MTIVCGVLAAVSFAGEMHTRWTLLSWLLPRRSSRNVVATISAEERTESRHTVVLLAHFDTQRTGLIWRGGLVKLFARLFQIVPGPLRSPTFLVMAAFVAQPIIGLLWIIYPELVAVDVGIGAIVVIYVVASFLLLNWARSPFVPGAADNATGTAAVIELARRWQEKGEHEAVELQMVLTGCEETGCLGAAAWAEARRNDLASRSCFFLNLDTFGYGTSRFIGVEHTLAAIPVKTPKAMLELCERAVDIHGLEDAGPHVIPTFTDGVAFLSRGIPGISLLGFADGVHMDNFHQPSDISENIDFDAAWDSVDFAWTVLELLAPDEEN
jgi:hypothetical protein